MKELLKKLASIPNDKLLHFFYGSLISYVFLGLGFKITLTFILVVSIGFIKEVYDKINSTLFSFVDFLYTVATPLILLLIDKI